MSTDRFDDDATMAKRVRGGSTRANARAGGVSSTLTLDDSPPPALAVARSARTPARPWYFRC